jgi:hypothetical protein
MAWELFLSITLGGLLAIAGGVIAQHVKHYYDRHKEDQDLMFQAVEILDKYLFLVDRISADMEPTDALRIMQTAIRIKSQRYQDLAVRLFRYGQKNEVRIDKRNLWTLHDDLLNAINKPVYERYLGRDKRKQKELMQQLKKQIEERQKE